SIRGRIEGTGVEEVIGAFQIASAIYNLKGPLNIHQQMYYLK
ncbi:22503_t:CDS:1, partial [Gigaspora rosea]